MNDEIEIALRRFKTLLIVDLEATCDRPQLPREEMETIEFGAVLVRMSDLQVIDERCWIVRPRIHPTLTPFCTELTSITQSQVDAGLPFEEVCGQAKAWIDPHRERLGWGSWGGYDRTQLRIDAARMGLESPLESLPHINLKVRFTKHHMLTRNERPGMQAALAMCGLSIEGTHHRGIDDARNVARMLPWILDNKLRGKIVRKKPLPMMNLAVGALGSDSDAKRWLRTPAEVLGWKRPCDVMKTRNGDRQVRDLLERMAQENDQQPLQRIVGHRKSHLGDPPLREVRKPDVTHDDEEEC